jgi:hypothetical protein
MNFRQWQNDDLFDLIVSWDVAVYFTMELFTLIATVQEDQSFPIQIVLNEEDFINKIFVAREMNIFSFCNV